MKNILLLAMPVLLGGAAPAADLPSHSTVSTAIHYNDLNLGSPEGKARLEQRLASAVRSLCRPSGRLTLSEADEANACVQSARESARRNLKVALNGVRGRPQDMADAGQSVSFERP